MRSVLGLTVLAMATAAVEAAPERGRPVLLGKLVECRTITDSTARLACYDQRVEAFDEAEKHRDLVVVDRQQVQQAKRSLFGFTLPHIDLFGPKQPGKDRDEEPDRIETTVQSVARDANGHWRFVLADGARWEQIDSEPMTIDPRPGAAIAIRRAALGSYFANVAKQTAIRVRRVG